MNSINLFISGSLIVMMLSVSLLASAQQPNSINSHEYYLNEISDSEQAYYDEVVGIYDNYLSNHPNDVDVLIEKCQFIAYAMYDEGDDWNPNYDAFEDCLQEIKDNHGEDVNARIYLCTQSYEDDAIVEALELISIYETSRLGINESMITDVYNKVFYDYYYNEDYSDALPYGQKALALDSELNIIEEIVHCLIEEEREAEAKNLIVEYTDSITDGYNIQLRAGSLLEIGEVDIAKKYLGWIDFDNDDSDTYKDYSVISDILLSAGDTVEARKYLLKQYDRAYTKTEAAEDLLDFDMAHGITDSIYSSYDKLRDIGWEVDPVGMKRFQVLLNHPGAPWSLRDLSGLLVILGLLLLVLVLPYLWVLPVYGIGRWMTSKSYAKGAPDFQFGLTHFWYASMGYLLASVIAMVVFLPNEFASYFSDSLFMDPETNENADANSSLAFMVLLAIFTFLTSRKFSITSLFRSSGGVGRFIGSVIGYYVLLRLVIYCCIKLFGIDSVLNEDTLSIAESIMRIAEVYGITLTFIMVVIIVPIYEEVIFRGIILSSCEKHLNYGLANVIQSILFALIHQDLNMFPFYFCMGLIAGRFVKQSQGLLVPILLHSLNNGLALLAIYYRMKYL